MALAKVRSGVLFLVYFSTLSHQIYVQMEEGGLEVISDQHLIEQLDQLDRNMTANEQKTNKVVDRKTTHVDACSFANLTYCADYIHYKVPKELAQFPVFAENLANANLDMTYIATHGKIRPCEDAFKDVICRNNFPKCFSGTKEVSWPGQKGRCGKTVGSCPQDARIFLTQSDICNKISTGKSKLHQCIPPIKMPDLKHCKLGPKDLVSPWLRAATLQVDVIFDIQYKVYNPSKECQTAVSSYLCGMANHCWDQDEIIATIESFHDLCMESRKACSEDHFGQAMTDTFLNCEKIEEAKRSQSKKI